MKFAARGAVLTVLMSGFALSGCSLIAPQAADTSPARSTEEPAVVDEVIAALEPLTGEDGHPDTQRLFETLIDAGYDPEDLESTLDVSPLGNEVPSKVFGVRAEEGCVVGEIRGGEAFAQLMAPSESTGACLLGDVERPEGVNAPAGEERTDGDADNGAGHIPGEDINRPRSDTSAPVEGDSGSDGGSPPELGGD